MATSAENLGMMLLNDATWLSKQGMGELGGMKDAATAADKTAQDSAARITNSTSALDSSANLLLNQGSQMNTQADAASTLLNPYISNLDPYKAKFGEYGDDLDALAAKMQGRADDVFGQGRALVALDPNAGGLAGEFMQHYDLLSPERYVSRYASDAQSSIDNTRAQTERYLSRRGVDVGSGANAGLMGALQRMKEAALLSAAKTLGYDKGVTERGNWLKDMTGAAKTLYDMGTQQQSQTLATKGAAADMASKSMGVVGQQATMAANQANMAAQMRRDAGDLMKSGASLFGTSASLGMDAAKLAQSGADALTDAFKNAASYYASIASSAYSGGTSMMNSAVRAEADVASAIARV